MRKALLLAICASGIPFFKGSRMHTQSQPQTKPKQTPVNTPKVEVKEDSTKDFETRYDIHKRQFKKYLHDEQRKLHPRLKTRKEHLLNLKDPSKVFDVLIIGSGSSGAGALLEASSRGFSCALIDNEDFGAETGYNSINLLDGGFKYFREAFRFRSGILSKLKLANDSLNERNYLVNSAGYMNKRLDLVIPCGNVVSLLWCYMMVNAYHFLGYLKWAYSDYTCKVPRPSLIGKKQMKIYFPSLKGAKYGIQFSEAQALNNRLLIQTLLTATQEDYIPYMQGAVLANYIDLVDFVKDKNGTCIGAKLKDKQDGKEFTVKAKAIVNCTEVSSDEIRTRDNPKAILRTIALKSNHLILPHKPSKEDIGILLPNNSQGRNLIMLPYKNFSVAEITCNEENVVTNLVKPEVDLKEIRSELAKHFDEALYKDCKAVWSNVRPLIVTKPKEPLFGIRNKIRELMGKTCIKREDVVANNYEIEVSNSGLISIVGGRWTTYRKAGQDLIETVLKEHPELASSTKTSVASDMRLIGAYTSRSFAKSSDKAEKNANEFIDQYKGFIKKKYSLDWEVAENLVEMYGAQAIKVAELGEKKKLGKRLHENYPFIRAQVLYAVKKEMAMSIRDVMYRRLGIGIISKKEAEEMIPVIADIIGAELGWSKEKKQQEIELTKKSLLSL